MPAEFVHLRKQLHGYIKYARAIRREGGWERNFMGSNVGIF